MSAAKHTPGPYCLDDESDTAEGSRMILAPDGTKLACTTGLYEDAEDIANARLLAAAPELLEALQYAEQWLADLQKRPGMRLSLQGAVDVARAAIAKATGGAA